MDSSLSTWGQAGTLHPLPPTLSTKGRGGQGIPDIPPSPGTVASLMSPHFPEPAPAAGSPRHPCSHPCQQQRWTHTGRALKSCSQNHVPSVQHKTSFLQYLQQQLGQRHLRGREEPDLGLPMQSKGQQWQTPARVLQADLPQNHSGASRVAQLPTNPFGPQCPSRAVLSWRWQVVPQPDPCPGRVSLSPARPRSCPLPSWDAEAEAAAGTLRAGAAPCRLHGSHLCRVTENGDNLQG